MTRVTLKPAAAWMPLVNDLLGADPMARAIARTELWLQVGAYVQRIARLPVGPLNDDDDAKAEISLRVLQKLEANDLAHLREWRARQLSGRNHASFWHFVKIMTAHAAINYARTSRRQIARRGEPFVWVHEEPVDPSVLGETVRTSLAFLERADEAALYDHMEQLSAGVLAARPSPASSPPAPGPATPPRPTMIHPRLVRRR